MYNSHHKHLKNTPSCCFDKYLFKPCKTLQKACLNQFKINIWPLFYTFWDQELSPFGSERLVGGGGGVRLENSTF